MTDIYQKKIQEYEVHSAGLTPELHSLSYTRLFIFLLTGILVMIFAASGWFLPVVSTAIAGSILFALTLRKYNQLSEEKARVEFLKRINEDEVKRLAHDLSGFATGTEFLHRDHPYSADLDLFGNHSLFQLLNRATTQSGSQVLARWLNLPADRQTIVERQGAVQELAGKLDWRQNFQAAGMRFQSTGSDYQLLLKWVEEKPQFLPSKSRLTIVAYTLAGVSTAALFYFVYNLTFHLHDLSGRHLLPLVVMLIINSVYKRKFTNIAEHIILSTQRNISILGGYRSLIKSIDNEPFKSKKLQTLSAILAQDGQKAAAEINALKRILEMFQQKGTRNTVGKNAFYGMLNSLLLIDIHLILETESWKLKNRERIRPWINAISEFEALSSMAGFAFANPEYAFAQISNEPYFIDFKTIGHPLLKPGKRVNNDFNMNGQGAITMITGSNMAGKSTFLRTIGINLVLTFAGAPCCATQAHVSLLRVFTSMRTQDNLEESVSSFYAELKRIEQLLALVAEGEPIFFLLDEMFKGTNSQDRFRGGVSLIRQLSELNAFGMISTHDLDLANLTKNLSIRNFSFNSAIAGGQIFFDYRLTPGICTDFNASELMKRSGIRILPDVLPFT